MKNTAFFFSCAESQLLLRTNAAKLIQEPKTNAQPDADTRDSDPSLVYLYFPFVPSLPNTCTIKLLVLYATSASFK